MLSKGLVQKPYVVPVIVAIAFETPLVNIITVTPTLSVAAVQVKLVVVEVVPEAVKLVGAVGVLVSTAGAVVRFALLLEAEMFPAASLAFTEKL
jgi:hypothetical protein